MAIAADGLEEAGIGAFWTRSASNVIDLLGGGSAAPSADMIVVPGGEGSRGESGDALLDWIRSVHETTKWTTSVCTGSSVG
jgi:putative intracellular protease/amidase